jgi:bla regulator protein blaR1
MNAPIMNLTLSGLDQMAALGLAALLNTLWYAAAVVALTWVVLRYSPRVNAATRYWIWTAVLGFIFVLPFLPGIVSHVRTALAERAHTTTSLAATSEPLATVPEPATNLRQPAPVTITVNDAPGSNPWPLWLLAVWFVAAGWQITRLAVGVVSVWQLKWRAKAAPISELPLNLRRRVRVLASDEVGSPVAVGYVHPAVIIPQELLARLEDGERQNVLLHELAHLRRYDDWLNLANRAVGAVLALHPLAPFVLGRIEREREMACDDFVVARTGAAGNYARSLARLHDLRWSAGTRLLAPALLGQNSSLAGRIESLLRRGREFSARPSLASLGVSAFLLAVLLIAGGFTPGWIAIAQTNATLPTSFEVASIRPGEPGDQHHDYMWRPSGRLDAINIWLEDLILHAYDIDTNQLTGLPSWAKSRVYTIRAVTPFDMSHLQTRQRMMVERQMLQSLLADRFRLKVHRATKQLPVYELVVAKEGTRLKSIGEADLMAGSAYHKDHPMAGGMESGPGSISAWGVQVSALAGALSGAVGRLVVDKTGLTGRYEIKLTWTPLPGEDGAMDSGSDAGNNKPRGMPDNMDFSGPSIFTALQEQLGLKLKSAKGPVEVLVVDHVEPPTPN